MDNETKSLHMYCLFKCHWHYYITLQTDPGLTHEFRSKRRALSLWPTFHLSLAKAQDPLPAKSSLNPENLNTTLTGDLIYMIQMLAVGMQKTHYSILKKFDS